MRRILLIALLAMLLAVPAAMAEDQATQPAGFVARVQALGQAQQALWGRTTGLVPAGALIVDFDLRYGAAHRKYDADSELAPLLESLIVPDPLTSGGEFLRLEFDTEGQGAFYGVGLGYAISDSLLAWTRLSFQQLRIKIDPTFTAGSSALLGVRTLDDYWRLCQGLGWPRMTLDYRSRNWEPGDMQLGLDWNWLRSDYLSFAGRLELTAPTGRLADPDEALAYGLGAQLDAGNGSWAPGAGLAMDWRLSDPLRFIGGALAVDYSYYLPGARRYPSFSAPDPTLAAALEQYGGGLFADFSDLDGEYTLTPGHALSYLVGLDCDLGWAWLAADYRFDWRDAPQIDSEREQFAQLTEMIGVYAEQTREYLQLSVGTRLARLGVPLEITLFGEVPLNGRNAPRLDQAYGIALRLLLPL
ncbi:MAG: hypothetical protein P9M14_15525 [Candidatus Alcyoniella australis]|nr:hypothetical protein [Candidatus Alcyoniella australis]